MLQARPKNIVWIFLILLLPACKRSWTEKDRTAFLSGCLGQSVRDLGETRGKAYCSCMLRKVEARYPNAADAHYMRQDTGIVRLASGCLKQP